MATLLDCNPPYLHPDYKASVARAPSERLVELPRGWFHDLPGPVFGRIPVGPDDNDLTSQHAGSPIGERILLSGRVLDSDGRPAPNVLIEIWQTNASGAYLDPADPGFVPLDPNFTGAGRTLTDSEGRYSFRSIKPAPYLGRTGGWFRPAHIHVSLFGSRLSHRLVTQCYFEGDPFVAHDPIAQSIPDPRGLERLIARLDVSNTETHGVDAAVAYHWDIVLRGSSATPMES
jgi:protocatechuate 3,4-dioxygenase beta subunit